MASKRQIFDPVLRQVHQHHMRSMYILNRIRGSKKDAGTKKLASGSDFDRVFMGFQGKESCGQRRDFGCRTGPDLVKYRELTDS